MNSAMAEKQSLSSSLTKNEQLFRDLFTGCDDIIFKSIVPDQKTRALLIYMNGMVNSAEMNEHLISSMLRRMPEWDTAKLSMEHVGTTVLALPHVAIEKEVDKLCYAVLEGCIVLLIDGYKEALVSFLQEGKRRDVSEPPTEAVIRGPREGFTESLATNIVLLRSKIKSPQLKMRMHRIGTQTRTMVAVTYLEGVADPEVLRTLEQRLQAIEIDAVLESGYIEELIEDSPFSPFPQLHHSERPDTVAAQLLEGRISIMIDGTPFVLIAPVTFWQLMQASEDYYERFGISTMIRLLRYIFLFIALLLPALYIAITTFHQDMLPTSLVLSIAAAREAIPFPAFVEALIMEIAFEALREAGIRLPRIIGQAVSILGALVIGQASVQAGIVSAPIVIIVSLTGIASFAIPRFNLAISIRMLRFPLMLAAALFGFFGIIIGAMLISLHLCRLESFGVPYLSGIAPFKRGEWKDIFIRAPWWSMKFRPSSYGHKNMRRQSSAKPTKGGESS